MSTYDESCVGPVEYHTLGSRVYPPLSHVHTEQDREIVVLWYDRCSPRILDRVQWMCYMGHPENGRPNVRYLTGYGGHIHRRLERNVGVRECYTDVYEPARPGVPIRPSTGSDHDFSYLSGT